tara:strand:- start:317 stop:919 length:603 start_codon:yes stop_codon:yes gene_type:complete
MKRINVQTVQHPHFIGCWNINNDDLCKNIINFFEHNQDLQAKGSTGLGVDESIKKSTDITINPNSLKEKKYDIFNDYFKNLNKCFLDYREQFSYLKTFLKKINIGPFNIQKYKSGDHFSQIHSERTDVTTLHRLFAWMTYLNDVKEDDGGTTDFDYYKIKIKPECGKTLIWPAEWTHAHAGSILKKGEKYIITGWIDFKV